MSTIVPQILVTDLSKGTTVLREMNETELAQRAKDEVETATKKVADDTAQAAQATARQALLTRLGLTEAEARLLFG